MGWLVCREICLPGKAYLGLNLNAVSQVGAETNKLIDAAVSAEPVNAPASVKIDATATRNMVTLSVVTGKQEASAEYYPLDDDSIRNAADQTIVPLVDGVKLNTERADISDTLPKELKGVLKLSGGRAYTFDVPVEAAVASTSRNGEPGFLAAGVVMAAALAVPLIKAPADRLQWQPYSSAALEEAQKAGKPIFVDFTAAWCLSCQSNEKAVLQDREVEQEFLRRHYVPLRADWTRYDPEITNELALIGRSGVPTYAIISRAGQTASHVLPELLTRSVVLEAIRQNRTETQSQATAPIPAGKIGG